jgi:membrane peptidoglycan carboxypeptidase
MVHKKQSKNMAKHMFSKKPKAKNSSSKLHTYTNSYHTKLSKKEQRRRDFHKNAPKSRVKRLFWRLHPKHAMSYWFSKDGLKTLGKLAAAGFVAMFLIVAGVYAFYKSELPNPNETNSRVLAQTTKFYDRKGKTLLFEVYGDQNRTVVKGDQISDNMRNATVAIEDKDFYNHGGFSVRGISRAFINNVTNSGGGTQGGSTITQQYIKNALLSNDKKIERKVKELILSVEMERLYSKDEILTFYLNEIPYGSLEYGIEAASKSFFDKPAKDLTIDEAAVMAAIPQAPTLYSPYSENTNLLIARRNTVIDKMAEQGYVTEAEAKEAKATDTLKNLNRNRNRYDGVIAPHFVLEAQKELENKYTAPVVNQSGWKVTTSLDLELQKTAEKVVKDKTPLVDSIGADNLAVTLGDQKTGQIMAMVGSRDFNYPKYGAYNAAKALRQPGSSFKPYAYAELFETGKWGPGSIMYDVKTDFGNYEPTNFNKNEQNGPITIRRALGRSLNIPAVKALYIAGKDNVIDQAKSQGITSLNDRERYGPALVLGAGEVKLADHVTGYEAFANGGIHYDQSYIRKIETPSGEVIENNEKPKGTRVLDEQAAYLLTDILSDRGVRTGALNNVNVKTAIKTGTTTNVKDLWTMGYSNHITAGVWVGNHDSTKMNTSSSLTIAPIFTQLINEVHTKKGWKSEDFKKPSGIKTVTLDNQTGKKPTGASRGGVHTDIFASNYSPVISGKKVSYTIDKISGKQATDCTPESTKEKVTGDGIEPEIGKDDPSYENWAKPIRALAAKLGVSFGGAKPTASDDVHKCSDEKPKVKEIEVKKSGGGYQINASISQGTHPLSKIIFKLDGKEVSAQGGGGSGVYSKTISIPGGSHTVSVDVEDKAGYVGSASKGVSGGGNSNLSANSPGGNISSPVIFSWSGGKGPFTVEWDGASSGTVGSSGQSAIQPLNPGNYKWRVTDSDGDETSWKNFKVN